jgi:LPS export ABC transporter protein LptC
MRWQQQIKKRYVTLAAVFVLIIVGLLHTVGYDLFHKKTNERNLPRAIMHNVTVHQYGADGALSEILITPKLVNYAKDNTSFLTTPNITIFSPPGPAWKITSVYGRAIQGIDTILLWNNVVMQRPGSIFHPPAKMTTDHFTFYPKTKTGHTNAAVTLTQPGMVVTAIGAKADLNNKTITLLSHTKGVYSNNSNATKTNAGVNRGNTTRRAS